MAKTTSGGRAQADIFRVYSAEDGTLTINDGLTFADPVAAAAANADKAFTLSEIVGTSPAYQEDGTVKVTFDQYEDSEEMDALLDTVATPPPSATGALPTYKLENGTPRSTASANNNLVLLAYYGANSGAVNGNKTKMLLAVGTISPTSGSTSSKADDWNKPTFEFVGTKISKSLTIASALLDSSLLAPTGSYVIAANTCFKKVWVPNKV